MARSRFMALTSIRLSLNVHQFHGTAHFCITRAASGVMRFDASFRVRRPAGIECSIRTFNNVAITRHENFISSFLFLRFARKLCFQIMSAQCVGQSRAALPDCRPPSTNRPLRVHPARLRGLCPASLRRSDTPSSFPCSISSRNPLSAAIKVSSA